MVVVDVVVVVDVGSRNQFVLGVDCWMWGRLQLRLVIGIYVHVGGWVYSVRIWLIGGVESWLVGWLGSCGGKLKIFLSSSLSAVIAAQVRVMLAMGAVHTRVIVRGRCLHVTSLAAKSISAPGRFTREQRSRVSFTCNISLRLLTTDFIR